MQIYFFGSIINAEGNREAMRYIAECMAKLYSGDYGDITERRRYWNNNQIPPDEEGGYNTNSIEGIYPPRSGLEDNIRITVYKTTYKNEVTYDMHIIYQKDDEAIQGAGESVKNRKGTTWQGNYRRE